MSLQEIHNILSVHWLFSLFVLVILINESVSKIIKNSWKNKYIVPYEHSENIINNTFYLDYYRKVKYLDIYRVLVIVFFVATFVLTKNANFFNIFAVGIGAIIIVFQSYIQDLIVYLMLINNYKIGDTIRVGDGWQGELVYLKPFYMLISGKNSTGEHTGELYTVGNNNAWSKGIVKVDLGLNSLTKVLMKIVFIREQYPFGFEEFMSRLESYLDKTFQINTAADVGYYKTYIGHKYKFDIAYGDHGEIIIGLGFLTLLGSAPEAKREIMHFVEGLKKID